MIFLPIAGFCRCSLVAAGPYLCNEYAAMKLASERGLFAVSVRCGVGDLLSKRRALEIFISVIFVNFFYVRASALGFWPWTPSICQES